MFNLLKKLFSSSKPHIRMGLVAADERVVKTKWSEIEELVKLGNPSRFKSAIMEADKLLDFALKNLGYPGNGLADRMKAIPREKYSREFFNNMWEAHKIRNEIVHNIEYEIHSAVAEDAINKFKKTFRELGINL